MLETHLEKSPSGFLVGDRLTIADISCIGWANSHSASPTAPSPSHLNRPPPEANTPKDWSGIPFDEFPNVTAWFERVKARDAVKRGFAVPDSNAADRANLSEEEREKLAASTRAWVQGGMAEDAKK